MNFMFTPASHYGSSMGQIIRVSHKFFSPLTCHDSLDLVLGTQALDFLDELLVRAIPLFHA